MAAAAAPVAGIDGVATFANAAATSGNTVAANATHAFASVIRKRTEASADALNAIATAFPAQLAALAQSAMAAAKLADKSTHTSNVSVKRSFTEHESDLTQVLSLSLSTLPLFPFPLSPIVTAASVAASVVSNSSNNTNGDNAIPLTVAAPVEAARLLRLSQALPTLALLCRLRAAVPRSVVRPASLEPPPLVALPFVTSAWHPVVRTVASAHGHSAATALGQGQTNSHGRSGDVSASSLMSHYNQPGSTAGAAEASAATAAAIGALAGVTGATAAESLARVAAAATAAANALATAGDAVADAFSDSVSHSDARRGDRGITVTIDANAGAVAAGAVAAAGVMSLRLFHMMNGENIGLPSLPPSITVATPVHPLSPLANSVLPISTRDDSVNALIAQTQTAVITQSQAASPAHDKGSVSRGAVDSALAWLGSGPGPAAGAAAAAGPGRGLQLWSDSELSTAAAAARSARTVDNTGGRATVSTSQHTQRKHSRGAAAMSSNGSGMNVFITLVKAAANNSSVFATSDLNNPGACCERVMLQRHAVAVSESALSLDPAALTLIHFTPHTAHHNIIANSSPSDQSTSQLPLLRASSVVTITLPTVAAKDFGAYGKDPSVPAPGLAPGSGLGAIRLLLPAGAGGRGAASGVPSPAAESANIVFTHDLVLKAVDVARALVAAAAEARAAAQIKAAATAAAANANVRRSLTGSQSNRATATRTARSAEAVNEAAVVLSESDATNTGDAEDNAAEGAFAVVNVASVAAQVVDNALSLPSVTATTPAAAAALAEADEADAAVAAASPVILLRTLNLIFAFITRVLPTVTTAEIADTVFTRTLYSPHALTTTETGFTAATPTDATVAAGRALVGLRLAESRQGQRSQTGRADDTNDAGPYSGTVRGWTMGCATIEMRNVRLPVHKPQENKSERSSSDAVESDVTVLCGGCDDNDVVTVDDTEGESDVITLDSDRDNDNVIINDDNDVIVTTVKTRASSRATTSASNNAGAGSFARDSLSRHTQSRALLGSKATARARTGKEAHAQNFTSNVTHSQSNNVQQKNTGIVADTLTHSCPYDVAYPLLAHLPPCAPPYFHTAAFAEAMEAFPRLPTTLTPHGQYLDEVGGEWPPVQVWAPSTPPQHQQRQQQHQSAYKQGTESQLPDARPTLILAGSLATTFINPTRGNCTCPSCLNNESNSANSTSDAGTGSVRALAAAGLPSNVKPLYPHPVAEIGRAHV